MALPARTVALRAAIEGALDATADLTCTPAAIRIHAPAPSTLEHDTWKALFAALAAADRWGTTDADGDIRIWAEIDESRGAP